MPETYCDLHFSKTITQWDEAIPLGNGFMGALVWGPAEALRFSLDRTDLWDTTTSAAIESTEFTYETMVRLAREGKEEEIRRIFDAPYNAALPSKLPAGKLIVDTGDRGEVKSHLELSGAQAVLETEHTRIRTFVHAQKRVGFLKIETPGEVLLRLDNPDYGTTEEYDKVTGDNWAHSLKQLCYPKPVRGEDDDRLWYLQEINPSFQYGIFLLKKKTAEGWEIVYTVGASRDGKDWTDRIWKLLKEALDQGYRANFEEHTGWWRQYWEKSAVSLPDHEMEKNWYLTNYLFASCSRKGCYPMPLQGVWTADDGMLPPWKGDYHMDLNMQMSYYHYLKANHLEEGESYLDYLWDMAECGRRFAKRFYGTKKGLCLPAVMTIDGKPLGGWGMYALSPANQLWLCQAFERHYRFTGDRKFLKERAYPYMAETAEFLTELLEERDGFYYLPISSSPEIHDDRIEAFVTPNSNYDLSLMRYLFQSLAALAAEQGLGREEARRWEKMLEKLPPLSVNEGHVLMVSPDESLEESHRHMSHLMAVHPLRLLDYHTQEGKRIIDASVLDLERLGKGNWVGFSFTWAAELYAVQGNGDAAAYQLETFRKHLCSPNGFHLNGDYKTLGITCMHYRPFTLEANFCAADALQEMLLQSENGILDFFPAIPDSWKEERVSFTTLRAEKGMLVSAVLKQGRVNRICLESAGGRSLRIRKSPCLEGLAEKYGWPQEEDCCRVECPGEKTEFIL